MTASAPIMPLSDVRDPATPDARLDARDWAVIVLLGIGHMFVDATSIMAANLAASMPGDGIALAANIIATYNLMAFSPQIVLGLFVDLLPARFARLLAALGAAMVATAALIYMQPAMLVIAMAGIGNALYHVAAGGICLRLSRGKAAPGGVFVAPGGIGVVLGTFAGRGVWPIGGMLLIGCAVSAAIAAFARHDGSTPDADKFDGPLTEFAFPRFVFVLLLLILVVASRQLVGGSIGGRWLDTPAAWIALACVAMFGKATFGFLADHLGWMLVTMGAALLAAPLLASSWGPLPVDVVATFTLQATMPVTLVLAHRLWPRFPATAFGLTGAAIWLGTVPAALGAGPLRPLTLCAIPVLTVCGIAMAIRLIGAGRRTEDGN